MIRDYRKLHVFHEADALVIDVYKATSAMPFQERYGLQNQIRRAAVSVPCNIVEGTGRPKPGDYCRFIHIARSSARETGYLIDLSVRLGFLQSGQANRLAERYVGLDAGLFRLSESIDPTSYADYQAD